MLLQDFTGKDTTGLNRAKQAGSEKQRTEQCRTVGDRMKRNRIG